jgi:hypothetical protein
MPPPAERPAFPGGGRYHRLGPALRRRFGQRVHKVTLRGGFGCPNRDGRIGRGGCRFCSAEALLPAGGPGGGPIADQLAAGLAAVERRVGARAAVAYFQEGCATDAPLERLKRMFGEAIRHPQVVALSVGTRPDWLAPEVLDLLAGLSRLKPVWLELGLQSANDDLLAAMNRGHDCATFCRTAERARAAGIELVAHVILDLPGETAADRRATAACLNRVGVSGVKVHNLHVLAGTPLAADWRAGGLQLADLATYAHMAADFLQWLDPAVVVHRLTGDGPAGLMLAPDWWRDKRRALAAVEAALATGDRWQGRCIAPTPADRSGDPIDPNPPPRQRC